MVVGLNQSITVTLSDSNLLIWPNEPSDEAAYSARNLTGGFCDGVYPMGVAVYQGKYVLQNLSGRNFLPVTDEFTILFCPAELGPLFRLAPFSSDTQTLTLAGYWTQGATPQPGGGASMGVLHPFAAGEYTLVAGDAWGHVQVLYFQVTQ